MTKLAGQSERHGFTGVFLSVADVNLELNFIKRLYKSIQQVPEGKEVMNRVSKGSVSRYLKRIRKIGISTGTFELADDAQGHWTELGDALAAALGQSNARWLLRIDQTPHIFVLSLIQQDETMGRAVSSCGCANFGVGPASAKSIRWFLAGSIGLDTCTRRAQIGDTVNVLFSVAATSDLSEDVARDFLGELGKAYGNDPFGRCQDSHLPTCWLANSLPPAILFAGA